MSVIKVTADNFENEVVKSDGTVLADFNADWCGPCRMLAPVLEEFAEEHKDVKVVSINIDEDDELAEEYDVSSIPCIVVFKNGVEFERSVGFRQKEDIEELVGE